MASIPMTLISNYPKAVRAVELHLTVTGPATHHDFFSLGLFSGHDPRQCRACQHNLESAYTVWTSAVLYLRHVAKITGAYVIELMDGSFIARLSIQDHLFTVETYRIHRYSEYNHYTQNTCYRLCGIVPDPERIASALLALYNDPEVFNRWNYERYYYQPARPILCE